MLEQKYQQKQQEKEKAEELRADEEHRQQREIQQEQVNACKLAQNSEKLPIMTGETTETEEIRS